jgi:septal ring factor EnvC (AmiA/AmiB activator)
MVDNKVAILLEDVRSQFRTFGEGLQLLNEKMDTHIEENRKELKTIQNSLDQNRQEHQQLMQMIKELDTEVIQIKRIK